MAVSQLIGVDDLARLHPEGMRDVSGVRALLEQAASERATLYRGMNRAVRPESATIEEIRGGELVLATENFAATGREQIFLRFELNGNRYFFSADPLSPESESPLIVRVPDVVFQNERRERLRSGDLSGERVVLRGEGKAFRGEILDSSEAGLAIRAEATSAPQSGASFELEFDTSASRHSHRFARVAGVTRDANGWSRIHLKTSPVPYAPAVGVDRKDAIVERSSSQRLLRKLAVASGATASATEQLLRRAGLGTRDTKIHLVEFETEDREPIRGIADEWGRGEGRLGVVIPPAWGRTKETLMPLARTLLATFRAASQPVSILRFDGVRKRGESYRDPDCLQPGREHDRFTFSQGVKDIRAAANFLRRERGCEKLALVTFSASSIEGRAYLASDRGETVDAWICVVGTADIQSMMRVISGGVDYMGGIEKGLSFGRQEILGVTVDIDYAGVDATQQGLSFLSDSRRDFSQIFVPITWLHGRFDAWMELDRVREVLACGSAGNRKLLEVPTGHQLRSSQEALDVFQLIAEEVSQAALERRISGRAPSIRDLAKRSAAERSRLGQAEPNVADFWADYLLGRSSGMGIALLNATHDYQEFMQRQVADLQLTPGNRVLDLGSGTGAFPSYLRRAGSQPALQLVECDLVMGALQHVKTQIRRDASLSVEFVQADLKRSVLPLASGSCDRVLASLLLSYVPDAKSVLTEIARVLRPQGRLVLSTMRPDADISQIYTRALAGVEDGQFDSFFPGASRAQIMQAARAFLNDGAKLMDLEEAGAFQFWSEIAFRKLIESAGLRVESVFPCLGSPQQAIVASATRA